MPYPGPWLTPHTTRFGSIDSSPPLDYITTYQGDTWADTVNGAGPTSVGPFHSTADATSPAPAEILHYDVFPTFNRYRAAQALSWHPLPAVNPAVSFPPYTDTSPNPALTVVGVEYEAAHGTMLTSPRVEIVATASGGNTNLPAALMDVYQLDAGAVGGAGYYWQDPAALAAISAARVGSIDSDDSDIFSGSTVSPTSTVVVLVASAAALGDPFPYSTPGSVGFQQFAAVDALVEYVGPRFRFLYEGRPPLAHRQRRDGAATAGPQLAHLGTTGGRPSLAWRQNNP